MNYDASAVADRIWPVEALDQLRSLIGDFVVVGALARDFVVHGLAGLPRGRDTVGPHLEGQEVGRMTDRRTAERLLRVLSQNDVDRLALKIPGHERRQQLQAFREGLGNELGERR